MQLRDATCTRRALQAGKQTMTVKKMQREELSPFGGMHWDTLVCVMHARRRRAQELQALQDRRDALLSML